MFSIKKVFFNPKSFAFVLAILVVALFWAFRSFLLFKNIDNAVLDLQFSMKVSREQKSISEGANLLEDNLRISPDILLVGIDENSLSRLGRWPWERYRHADFLDSLSRIQNQDTRESAVLLDVFFYEPSEQAGNDALLRDAIASNGRVFLETTLDQGEPGGTLQEQYQKSADALLYRTGTITNIKGPWQDALPFKTVRAPLIPFGEKVHGSGHATFLADSDEKYRRQALVARISRRIGEYDINELKAGMKADVDAFQRFGWSDTEGNDHTLVSVGDEAALEKLRKEIQASSPPRTVDSDEDGTPDTQEYVLYVYQDSFIPSITLSLALSYFNKSLSDIEVTYGDCILIRAPMQFDPDNGTWGPYRIMTATPQYDENQNETSPGTWRVMDEIRIPIDDQGMMLINFMGPRTSELVEGNHTFNLRSYSGYASRPTTPDPSTWTRSLGLSNKIIMAGAFSQGIADDEKSTPLGLMYGVELHANALNTILMANFLHQVPWYFALLILLGFSVFVAWYSARLDTPWSVLATLVLVIALFFGTTLLFETFGLVIDFSGPSLTMLFTLLAVIAYRVMTEEREKRRIQGMFGKYVSKEMVDAMIESGQQPELGGVDKELTVLFSDIRGFTTLSESMSPQELVNHLNVYLTEMTNIIFEYSGTLDKYVGDEVMCFWGAPVPQADHALLACRCALRQMERLRELNENWPPEKRIDIGIGVNSGVMTVGNMGSPGRLNYTLMGDNVNLGARLEGTNKAYFTHVIISEYTYGLVKDRVVVRELDNIRVKGKNKPVVIYELVDIIETPELSHDADQAAKDGAAPVS